MAQESASDLMFVDDFYFSLFFDEEADEILSVSDAKYAEGLQLQEALMVDIITSQMANTGASSSPTTQAISPPTANPEAGESSSSSTSSFCDICVERKDGHQMFRNEGSCLHSFCSDCIGKHVSTKIQLGMTIVSCPGLECKVVLELDACRPMLPKDVMERWDEELCRALIASEMKFYCPFKDCSGVLVNDKEEREVMIRESECPFCHRLFCAQCCVPWHPGIECEEFQGINENERETEDLMLREIAREKKWKRCPNCKFYVERTQGCLHIICRLNKILDQSNLFPVFVWM
ncbi:E3 ubiquitin-protein ligase RSL1-like isoform X2 [Corylus avellana]|uniref:E3 ubiquitin-protein ligase RSL1-like isoform X2 n=1 Tax=Corylus avellana TaxID=13451 RepID=UPI00286D3210|nr:E3 ubiquitin-protein ligase RSL1-like isoform X2 [Corylus avellana]